MQKQIFRVLLPLFTGVYFLGSSLPSLFVNIASFPILVWPIAFILNANRILQRHYLSALTIISFGVISLLIASAHNNIPLIEIFKSAIGCFAFLSTVIFLPNLVLRGGDYIYTLLKAILVLHLIAFFLEYFEIFNAKEAGLIIYGFAKSGVENNIQLRTSGLAVEPAWFSLTVSINAHFLLIAKKITIKEFILFLATSLSILLSKSAIGLFLLVFLTVVVASSIHKQFSFFYARIEKAPFLKWGTILSLLVIAFMAQLFLSLGEKLVSNEVVAKIFHPTENPSGYLRYVTPIPFILEVFKESPLTGFGFDYLNSSLNGMKVGTSVLPFNVFIELGVIGLAIYAYAIWFALKECHPRPSQIALMTFILLAIGLPYNPYNAFLIVLTLTGFTYGNSVRECLTLKS